MKISVIFALVFLAAVCVFNSKAYSLGEENERVSDPEVLEEHHGESLRVKRATCEISGCNAGCHCLWDSCICPDRR
ncbi:hypothetical protein JTB14_005209 [Gonioctena quinquepunctata]|nr:hypothetical protein JTB14_005209 [Gonioctena quinquepunctata]